MEGKIDLKPQPDGSLSEKQMAQILYDLRAEPQWRDTAAREEEFFDGNQLEQQTLVLMRDNGIPPIVVNLIQPVINAVGGFESSYRTDPIVLPDDDESVQGAEALNQDLKQALRLTEFNEAMSEAFMSAAKVGIGWVEVSRRADPFQYRYRCEYVPWREMWWDWRCRKKDLSDARYWVRRKWYDRDHLATLMPQHRKAIMEATSSWPTGAPGDWDTSEVNILRPMGRSLNEQSEYQSTEQFEWLDPDYRRIALFEVVYRVPVVVTVIRLPDGRVIEYDPKNVHQTAAIAAGRVAVEKAPTTKLRQGLYLGPHRLRDRALKGNRCHYVPVVWSLEGGDGSPYGIIRHMVSPQESYNARYSRVLHDLSARRVIASEDAVEDHDRTAREINRPDAYIKLRTSRTPQSVFEVIQNTDVTPVTLQLMETARGDIEAATGLFSTFQGEPSGANQSGIAIDRLNTQGAQVLGPFMRNYDMARRQAAILLLQMRIQDLSQEENVEVRVERSMSKAPHTVVLNKITDDGRRSNDVTHLRTRIALSETPSTRTYRQQQAQLFTEVLKALPPELQVAMTDLFVDLTDAPHKEEILERVRQVTGIGPKSEDPQERAAQEAKEQQQAALEQKMQELDILEREAEARLKLANARLTEAKAVKLTEADTRYTEAQTLAEIASIQQGEEEGERADIELQRDLAETSARLMEESRQQAREESEAAEKKREQKAAKPSPSKR